MNEKSICSLGLAEQQGFEPWRRSPGLRDFEFLQPNLLYWNIVEDGCSYRKIKTIAFSIFFPP